MAFARPVLRVARPFLTGGAPTGVAALTALRRASTGTRLQKTMRARSRTLAPFTPYTPVAASSATLTKTRAMSTSSHSGGSGASPGSTPSTALSESLMEHPGYVGARSDRASYPKKWLFFEDRPDNAGQVAYDDDGRYTGGEGHRFDHRSPSEMMTAGAFVGRGESLDISAHQLGGSNLSKSKLVSWAKEESGSNVIKKVIGRKERPGFTYYTRTGLGAHNTFDVADLYKWSPMSADVHEQHEVASTHTSLADIEHVKDHARREKILHPFRPITGIAMSDMVQSF